MKIRTDIIKMYKEVHSWVGIIAGLFLFIAFYAGAITMFEEPLQRWASPPMSLPGPVSLERTPELVDKLIAAHPAAAKNYQVNVEIDGNRPARVSWREGPGRGTVAYAALDANGALRTSRQAPSQVAEFVNRLHQQVGLAFWPAVTRPLMGVVAMLYVIAIVSGLFVLLPSLVADLYALRLGKNLKRMWLDVHNLLGLFSLPFHLVMAVTSVGFSVFPYFYQSQQAAFGYRDIHDEHGVRGTEPVLGPAVLVQRVQAEAPGLRVVEISYARESDGALETHVAGHFPGHAVRNGSLAAADVDAYTGRITDAEFLPGRRGYAGGFATNFIGTHFGNYGGDPVRWAYLLLGLAGAALFYTGNLIWIESRRKRERKAGLPEQTHSTKILGALTVGVPLGCVAGISITLVAAKLFGSTATAWLHSASYYAVFLGFVAYALWRGAARAGVQLAGSAAAATLAIPIVSILAGRSWYQNGATIAVDLTAIVIGSALMLAATSARRRVERGPRDSIWSGSATT